MYNLELHSKLYIKVRKKRGIETSLYKVSDICKVMFF